MFCGDLFDILAKDDLIALQEKNKEFNFNYNMIFKGKASLSYLAAYYDAMK